ncbi:hypothetical protein, variant 1 [Aphanomyces invadans]|uniref:Cyclic nucleotide-binding domain-containing protein n=1 Tax=Aphanomyces invadans TaxID=157072 RepID=A0A024UIB4_9STRA|nr:hypothetical protein, variant 1 [Aphanomyces invadans]ETW05617.1 hypothetical protein, variant 1 [Aphanomyces invadans]|eukprot:XP_008865394.1 hypothetical protein, variant 1 [Aphanomyces invadans]
MGTSTKQDSVGADGSGKQDGSGKVVKSSSSQRLLHAATDGPIKVLRSMAERPSMILRRVGSDKKLPSTSAAPASTSSHDRKKSGRGNTRVLPFAPERLSIINSMHNLETAQSFPQTGTSMKQGTTATAGVLVASAKLHSQLARVREREAESSFRKHMEAQLHAKAAARHQNVLTQYKIRELHKPKAEDDDMTNSCGVKSTYLIKPSSTWFKSWQLIGLVIAVVEAYWIPFSLAFVSAKDRASPTHDMFSIASSVFFAVDILFRCNTITRDPHDPSKYVMKRSRLVKQYLTGWFIVDMVSTVPFDLVVYNLVGPDKYQDFHVLGLLREGRLPRLLRLIHMSTILRLLRVSPEWLEWLNYSRYSHLIRLVSLIVFYLTLTHLVACVWGGFIAKPDWLMEIVPESDATTVLPIRSTRYFLFSSVATILGQLVLAIVFGNVADLLANFYENNNTYKRKIESLFTSMDLMKLPPQLQHRINEYYQAMWTKYGTLDGTTNQFMRELSTNLAKEVELFLRMDMINRAPFFYGCSKKFVEAIVMCLELNVYLAGDYIVVRGEVGHDMYFVQSGTCEVTKGIDCDRVGSSVTTESAADGLHPDEIVLKTLTQGDYFGELSLLMNCKRTANVRARSFAELCVLSRTIFDQISDMYVEDRVSIESFIFGKYDPALVHEVLRQQAAHEAAAAAKENQDRITSNFQKVFDHLGAMEARLMAMHNWQVEMSSTMPKPSQGDSSAATTTTSTAFLPRSSMTRPTPYALADESLMFLSGVQEE